MTKYYYPAVGYGGPVQCSYNLSKNLARRGHEVTVYTTDSSYPDLRRRILPQVQMIADVEVHFFPTRVAAFDMLVTPAMIPAFRRNIRDYDIVHLHECRSFQNAAFFLYRNGVPYVVQTHGIKPPEYASFEGKPLHVAARRVYDEAFGRRLLEGASKVIALTKSEKTLVEAFGIDDGRIVVIPNGVSPEDFCFRSGENKFRNEFGLAESRIVLYVGRINRTKGIETLVKAFYLLQGGRTDLKLAIVGPDDGYLTGLRDIVRSLKMESKVAFTGLLNHEQIASAYEAADVVVYPGTHEGFPVVPLEAGIMGKPLVVSDDPGMDYVREGKFGLSFEYGNEHQLQASLQRILEDHDLARKLGQAGKEWVSENYTWEIVARRIEELYESVL